MRRRHGPEAGLAPSWRILEELDCVAAGCFRRLATTHDNHLAGLLRRTSPFLLYTYGFVSTAWMKFFGLLVEGVFVLSDDWGPLLLRARYALGFLALDFLVFLLSWIIPPSGLVVAAIAMLGSMQ